MAGYRGRRRTALASRSTERVLPGAQFGERLDDVPQRTPGVGFGGHPDIGFGRTQEGIRRALDRDLRRDRREPARPLLGLARLAVADGAVAGLDGAREG